jgi:hypothetical protein
MGRTTIAALCFVCLGACSPPIGGEACTSRLEKLSRDYTEATREIDRTCGIDDDCVLVVDDLPCIASCEVAVSRAAASKYATIRASFSSKCESNCVGAFDCLSAPTVARCRSGFCRAER